MPPKYVFNHICISGGAEWFAYHKLGKKIPKTVDCYGSKYVAKGDTVEDAINSAVKNGVKRFDIQVIGDEKTE